MPTAEKDFILKDKSGENKYGVTLASALKRAKDFRDKGGLLKGHTFYLTPKVPVDTKLLKNVVVACGGLVRPFFLSFFLNSLR